MDNQDAANCSRNFTFPADSAEISSGLSIYLNIWDFASGLADLNFGANVHIPP
jgi:hypothetical protein